MFDRCFNGPKANIRVLSMCVLEIDVFENLKSVVLRLIMESASLGRRAHVLELASEWATNLIGFFSLVCAMFNAFDTN
jgi:hypothetical protein